MENHNIIRQLYQNTLKEEANKDKISKETKTEVEVLLKETGSTEDGLDYEKRRDDLLLLAAAAEENGFVKGFSYAFRLFAECTKE